MAKSLSVEIMDVWVRSSEQECVKRLSFSGVTAIGVRLKIVISG